MSDDSDHYDSPRDVETDIDELLQLDPTIGGIELFDFAAIEDPVGTCIEFFAEKGHTIKPDLAKAILQYGIKLAFIAEISMTEKIMGFCATPPNRISNADELLKFIGMKTVIAGAVICPAIIGNPTQTEISRMAGCSKNNVNKIVKHVTAMIHAYRGEVEQ